MYCVRPTIVGLAVSLLYLSTYTHAQPPAPARADAPQPALDLANEPEVLDGAPLHEAFARPLALEAQAIVIDREPPKAIEEIPPEERPEGKNVHWLPGYWYFDVERADFVWISGLWRDFPPGRAWVPGEWQQVETGYQWVAGYWAETQDQQQPLLPLPPPTLEVGPSSPAPANNYLWAPGCWQWQGATYAWQPGFWYAAQPNWVWVPSHYSYTPRGVLFVRGYWDYPLVRRGLLYAPVCWRSGYRFGAGFTYRPRTFINTNLLISSLFLDHHHGRYYYGPKWVSARSHPTWLSPWGTHSLSRYGRYHGRSKLYDPLWSHFRWDGHAKHGHGKFRHQDLAMTTRTIKRSTKTEELFRNMDRLTVADRKSFNLQRNNAKDLSRFRQETEKYQQFNRSKMVRDQLAKTGNRTTLQRTRTNQLAGSSKPVAKKTLANPQPKVDRVVTNKTETRTRVRDLSKSQAEQAKSQARKRRAAITRAQVDNRVKTATTSPTAQLRQNAQLRSNASRNVITQRTNDNFQSQLLKRQEKMLSLRESDSPALTRGNTSARSNIGSRYNRRRTLPTTTTQPTNTPSTRSTLAQPTTRTRQIPTRSQPQQRTVQQRTAKPSTTVNSMRNLRANTASQQRTRPNYRPSTRRALPTTQPAAQASGRSMQRSRSLSGRNFGQQMQRRNGKSP